MIVNSVVGDFVGQSDLHFLEVFWPKPTICLLWTMAQWQKIEDCVVTVFFPFGVKCHSFNSKLEVTLSAKCFKKLTTNSFK